MEPWSHGATHGIGRDPIGRVYVGVGVGVGDKTPPFGNHADMRRAVRGEERSKRASGGGGSPWGHEKGSAGSAGMVPSEGTHGQGVCGGGSRGGGGEGLEQTEP